MMLIALAERQRDLAHGLMHAGDNSLTVSIIVGSN